MKTHLATVALVALLVLGAWLLHLMPAQAGNVQPSGGAGGGSGTIGTSTAGALTVYTAPNSVGGVAAGNSGNLAIDNGAAFASYAVAGDICEESLATFTLCAIQGIPIQGTLSTTVAGQVFTTDGASHVVVSTTYVSVSTMFSTPTASLPLGANIPALNFNANFGAANNVPAASDSCLSSAPSSGRDFVVNCMVSNSLTHIGDITVSTSCTTTGDSSVTLTTVGGTAKSCSAGTFDIVAPATVDGAGIIITVNGHS